MSEDKVIEKLLGHDEKFELIIKKIIDHDEQLIEIKEHMSSKNDIGDIKETLEDMTTIIKKLDQERIFTAEWIDRIENKVEKHKQEITKLKQVLNIA